MSSRYLIYERTTSNKITGCGRPSLSLGLCHSLKIVLDFIASAAYGFIIVLFQKDVHGLSHAMLCYGRRY